MGKGTFHGGIHPPEYKDITKDIGIEHMNSPGTVRIPLNQHIGAPAVPVVKKGDEVLVGQVLGEAEGFVSSPVHSCVSGKVKKIEEIMLPSGRKSPGFIIESNGMDELQEDVSPIQDYESMSADEIRQMIRDAGIVGLGGAAFPTNVKLTPPEGKVIETVILNGCECEPYLTGDYRLMVESSDEIILGLKAIMAASGGKKAYIGIEDNKAEAIGIMKDKVKAEADIEVFVLETKYPQGGEKQLIYSILGKEVPSGGLPIDIGVVVNNVGTAFAIADRINSGMPLVERVVTVSGSIVKEPKNLIVRIGTPVQQVLEACGGLTEDPGMIIIGGPMMGCSISSMDVPVIKSTSGILVLSREQANENEKSPCIRCGKCVDACPMHLLPGDISHMAEYGQLDRAERYGIMDCMECGSCAYICPGNRYIVQWIRMAKAEIEARERKRSG